MLRKMSTGGECLFEADLVERADLKLGIGAVDDIRHCPSPRANSSVLRRSPSASSTMVSRLLIGLFTTASPFVRAAPPCYSRSLPNCVAGRRNGDNAVMMPSSTLPGRTRCNRIRSMALLALVALGLPAPAPAQDFYAGKTLKIIVGLEAGGTVDTMARLFVSYLRQAHPRHIP